MPRSRTVTTLFTDIVGSTELIRRMGSGAPAMRMRHFGDMRGALALHRGREVKTLGDGFMAVFDSACDGVACAVAMQRAVARHRRQGDQLRIRVGLSAGDVMLEDNDCFGESIVQASRLCAAAQPGQILAAGVLRMLLADGAPHELCSLGRIELKGLDGPLDVCDVTVPSEDRAALRVAIADDSVLLRRGIVRALEAEGVEVVLEAGDAEDLLRQVALAPPDVVVLDVRMPPTQTTEGLDAAIRIKSEHPDVGVLVLSAEIQATAAERLLRNGAVSGVGYLLKDRLGDIDELVRAIRTIAGGGRAIDPLVAQARR